MELVREEKGSEAKRAGEGKGSGKGRGDEQPGTGVRASPAKATPGDSSETHYQSAEAAQRRRKHRQWDMSAALEASKIHPSSRLAEAQATNHGTRYPNCPAQTAAAHGNTTEHHFHRAVAGSGNARRQAPGPKSRHRWHSASGAGAISGDIRIAAGAVEEECLVSSVPHLVPEPGGWGHSRARSRCYKQSSQYPYGAPGHCISLPRPRISLLVLVSLKPPPLPSPGFHSTPWIITTHPLQHRSRLPGLPLGPLKPPASHLSQCLEMEAWNVLPLLEQAGHVRTWIPRKETMVPAPKPVENGSSSTMLRQFGSNGSRGKESLVRALICFLLHFQVWGLGAGANLVCILFMAALCHHGQEQHSWIRTSPSLIPKWP
ncbi:hypothetical protein FDECE_12313 [Fusarium decemcellulare]|nr:hypothetical protein FDECE_12313 [Fusarium decemcellulare]